MKRLVLCIVFLIYFWAMFLSFMGYTDIFLIHVLSYWKLCLKKTIRFFQISGISPCCFSRLWNVGKAYKFPEICTKYYQNISTNAVLQTVWWVFKNFHFHVQMDFFFSPVEKSRYFGLTLFKTSLIKHSSSRWDF